MSQPCPLNAHDVEILMRLSRGERPFTPDLMVILQGLAKGLLETIPTTILLEELHSLGVADWEFYDSALDSAAWKLEVLCRQGAAA